jgi:hypothetical protein
MPECADCLAFMSLRDSRLWEGFGDMQTTCLCEAVCEDKLLREMRLSGLIPRISLSSGM